DAHRVGGRVQRSRQGDRAQAALSGEGKRQRKTQNRLLPQAEPPALPAHAGDGELANALTPGRDICGHSPTTMLRALACWRIASLPSAISSKESAGINASV